jgi:hypothetical protein
MSSMASDPDWCKKRWGRSLIETFNKNLDFKNNFSSSIYAEASFLGRKREEKRLADSTPECSQRYVTKPGLTTATTTT